MFIELKEKKKTYFVFRFPNKEEFEYYVTYIMHLVEVLEDNETYKKQGDMLRKMVKVARERLKEKDGKCAFAVCGDELAKLFMCINCATMLEKDAFRCKYGRMVDAYSMLATEYAKVVSVVPEEALAI